MTLWQVGDKAAVILTGRIACPTRPPVMHNGESCPAKGSILTVTSISFPEIRFTVSGKLAPTCGCIQLNFDDGSAAIGHRCRRLVPDKLEAATSDFHIRNPQDA